MFIKENYIIFLQVFWKMRWWLMPCILSFIFYCIIETIEDKQKRRKKKSTQYKVNKKNKKKERSR